MNNILKLLQFFQSSSGENSSKRLVFISASLFAFYEIHTSINALFAAAKYAEVITLLEYLMIFIAVIGGFVASDMVIKVVELIKGAAKMEGSVDKSISNSN